MTLESNLLQLFIVHIVVSVVFSIAIAKYIVKRFVKKGVGVLKKDTIRFQEFQDKSSFHQALFKISLHKNNEITSVFFFTLFNFSFPIVGYLFSLWIAWYMVTMKYDKKVSKTNSLNLDEFQTSFLKTERIFGEGSMSELMRSDYAPKSKKIRAISSLAHNPTPTNLKIIRETLTSSDDEIRMFGYAIINKAEMQLNTKINKQLEISSDAESTKEEQAVAAKELAFLYWEMVYSELSHESLKDNFLKEVVKYLKIAKEYFLPETIRIDKDLDSIKESKDKDEKLLITIENMERKLRNYKDIRVKLFVLSGRVHLNKREYEEASAEFSTAQELNENDSSFILPYLAEVHFRTGNYRIVQALINRAHDLEFNSTLYPIFEQWRFEKKKVAS